MILCKQYLKTRLKETTFHIRGVSNWYSKIFKNVDELYEYKNLGVPKNQVGLFSSNIDDKIDKTRKKVGTIFPSSFDHRKVNPFTYVKFWRQACLPTLLYGAELSTLNFYFIVKTWALPVLVSEKYVSCS